jgi:hypothetical protein
VIRHRVATIIGLVIVLTLGSAGAGHAFWAAPASVSGTVATKAIAMTETMPVSYGGTLSGTAAVTGAITITNTGSVAGTYSTAVTTASTSGSAALATAVTVVAWQTANPAGCAASSPTGTTASGTWANFPRLTGTLAPAAAVSYCVQSALGSTSGLSSDTVTPTITAVLSAGTNWSASAQVSATLSYTAPAPSATWYQLKNVATQRCATVSSTATGAAIVSADCSSPATLNGQAFKLSRSGTTSIVTNLVPTLGIAISSNGNTKPAITAVTTSGSGQLWTIAQSGTYYAFTNVDSGRCLADDSTSAGPALMVDNCWPNPSQQFSLEPIQ